MSKSCFRTFIGKLQLNSSRYIFGGVTFALLWASASVAGKFGLQSVQPLVLFNIRFIGAGVILLSYCYIIRDKVNLRSHELRPIALFGFLNTTLYLGLFVLALSSTSPGITTLAVALNPLLISLISSLWINRRPSWNEWLSVFLGLTGIWLAAFPLLGTSYASVEGLILLALSQTSYSIGAVYYSKVTWGKSRIAVNGWQVLFGGLFLLPFTLNSFDGDLNHFDSRLVLALGWLILPVSIGAIQLWLILLKRDPVKASLWLYLCPVFGFVYAAWLMEEPISWHTFTGTCIVLIALYIGQRRNN